LPEVVREGQTGLVVEARNKLALAEAITQLLEKPALARAFGDAGRAHVCATYDLQHSTDLLEQEYRKLLM
jgi:phosphatidylinositol alpha-1,6-mannosyltransferase